jgi:hypothetical protein
MALKFIDGFDHYATAQLTRKWSSQGGNQTGAVSIVSPGRFAGGFLRSNPAGSNTNYMIKMLPASATWVIGFAFRPNSLPSGNVQFCALWDTGAASQCELKLNGDGTISMTRNNTALTGGTSTLGISAGSWFYLEWKITIANAIAANSCKVRVNGVDFINVATGQDTQNSANASANLIALGTMSGVAQAALDFDDLYALDGSGTVNNDFLGDVRVEALYPGGAGTTTQWTPSAGGNYACVDDVTPNDDTDYVSSSTVGQKDTYVMSNLTGNAAAIAGIQSDLLHRKDDAGSRTVAAVIRSGGADYDGTAASVLDNYFYASEIRETDPATGTAWTITGVNAMEAGIKVVS